MTTETNQHEIDLPGYTLSDRLGAGGYGEVWRAEAPGGLTKAVKIIFGHHNEKRAEHELHALERIKEVRHPFLLSLERIEIIDGRLVIVTELADKSLKDRFDECIQAGRQGIPRDELLGYMSDAADALDFLSDRHSLQHLDVKPENLLLLAGHVKVADFGLVKKFRDTQASLVGGMTPLYSAPEVFNGRPSQQSDQYSLAILYQEMLTGISSFSGTTAAELTVQHLHDEPELSPLPDSDRYIIARALAKNPQQRYATCSELVHALQGKRDDHRGDSSEQANTWSTNPTQAGRCSSSTTARASRPVAITQVYDDDVRIDTAGPSESMSLELPALADPSVTTLPPLNLERNRFQPAPVLLIGVGGAASHVLRNVRRNLRKISSDEGVVPAVQMLLIDTDARSLVDATRDDKTGALKKEETLALALRRPQDYREQSSKLLRWLSRRWLYNIPRSLRTEGLRPLGRLAFVDHARQALQRIRMSLSQAVDADAIATSREQTGLPFQSDCVRVYVIASISGGTGSGMSLDVGYAVRTALDKLEIPNASTTGIFMHSTGRDPRSCDLAKVNAFSWLTEFNHFNRPEGFFPGDETCGLPARLSGEKTFDNTYLVQLGEALGDEEFSQAVESVADYIYLDALTPAQTFFDACRQDEDKSSLAPLRTFGLSRVTAASRCELEEFASALAYRVVLKWADTASKESSTSSLRPDPTIDGTARVAARDTDPLVHGAAQAVANLKLNLEGIASNVRVLVEEQFKGNLESALQKMLLDAPGATQEAPRAKMLHAVDGLFSDPDGSESQGIAHVLRRPIETIVHPLATQLAEDLRSWILQKLDNRQERVSGTVYAVEWFDQHLRVLEADAERLAVGLARDVAQMVQGVTPKPSAGDTSTNKQTGARPQVDEMLRYCRLKIDHCALLATGYVARILRADLTATRQTALDLGRHLQHLAENMMPKFDPFTPQKTMEMEKQHTSPQEHARWMLRAHATKLSDRVEEQLQSQFFDQQGGLSEAIVGNSRMRSDLLLKLRQVTVQIVEQFVSEINVLESVSMDADTSEQDMLKNTIAKTVPRLLECGGVSRHLAILPKSEPHKEDTQRWRNALDSNPTIISGTDNDFVLCCEACQIPLAHVAIALVERRRDYADFASRIHTRTDVQWTRLTDVAVNSRSSVPELQTQVL